MEAELHLEFLSCKDLLSSLLLTVEHWSFPLLILGKEQILPYLKKNPFSLVFWLHTFLMVMGKLLAFSLTHATVQQPTKFHLAWHAYSAINIF